LVNGYKSKAHAIHRLVMQYFGPEQPENCIVDHIDGIKTNNKLTNLQWMSIRHNTEKYYGNAEKKKMVIELLKQNKTVKEICAEVNLGHCTVRKTIAEYNLTI
jgi:DNA-binding NarL/FixJ family response regulator